jgi:hypothetical protein
MRVSQRGRAILRRISAHDALGGTGDARDTAEPTFRPGDFLLTSSSGGLARLLSLATGSKINHAAIIIDPQGTLIEANPSFFRPRQSFRLSSVSHYLKTGAPCWIGYVEVREGSRQEVAGYAEHLLRARGSSSMLGRLWLVLHTLLSIAPRSFAAHFSPTSPLRYALEHRSLIMREDLCYSSGELVARALERGGFIWEHDPAQITPADIFHHYRQPELAPALSSPKSAKIVRESLVGARTNPRKSSTVAPQVSLSPNLTGDPRPEAPTDDPTRTQTGWRTLWGIGVAAVVGLVCVDFLEQLMRFIRRTVS